MTDDLDWERLREVRLRGWPHHRWPICCKPEDARRCAICDPSQLQPSPSRSRHEVTERSQQQQDEGKSEAGTTKS